MPQVILSPKYAMEDDEYEEVEIEVEFKVTMDFAKGGKELFFDPIDTPGSASKKAGFEIDEDEFHHEWDRIQNELVGPAVVDKVTVDDAETVEEKKQAEERSISEAPAATRKAPAPQVQAPREELSFDVEEEIVDEEPEEREEIGI